MTMGEYIAYIAAYLTYWNCKDCWNIPCMCPAFRSDMIACVQALEMGY